MQAFLDWFNKISTDANYHHWVLLGLTAVIFLGSFVLRTVIGRAIRRNAKMSTETRRQWIVHTRNALFAFVLIALVVVWADQIRTVALSIVAIAAAIVIATKELILCISGAVLKASSRSFDIGDRIEINGYRGDVIDHNLFATTILEIGPGQTTHQQTGRAVTLPNSLFLSSPMVNETYTQKYVLHVFLVPLKAEDDWRAAEDLLLQASNEQCSSIIGEAREHFHQLGVEQGIEPPLVEPRISLNLPEPGRVNLVCRVPVPARRKGRFEQAILRRYLDLLKEHDIQIGSNKLGRDDSTMLP